jgi:hypothetical protein
MTSTEKLSKDCAGKARFVTRFAHSKYMMEKISGGRIFNFAFLIIGMDHLF